MNAAAGTLPSDPKAGDAPRRSAKSPSLRLRVSLVLTALAAAFVIAGAGLWVRDARTAIAEEIT
ncbi:hypothetical protein, partial [Zoogloea sp.]